MCRQVWKAKDTELDRMVVVKIPRKEQLSQAQGEQFLREARAAAQLRWARQISPKSSASVRGKPTPMSFARH